MRKRSEAKMGSVIDSLSAELDGVIQYKPAGVETNPRVAPIETVMPLFESTGAVKLSDDFAAIVERVFVKDALKEYNRLESALTVGEQRSDYATLLKHLDQAEDNARQAHRLFVTAKIERERYVMDASGVKGEMWAQATNALQTEKAAGLRNKAITDADVGAMAATLFPDQWHEHELGLVKVKAMQDHVERLAELWMQRCRSLTTMLSTLRK